MLVHPWDAVPDWRAALDGLDFGQLVTAGHVDGFPVVVPTHFVLDGDEVLLHLARPNPVWHALDHDDRVVLCVVADYVYVDSAMNADSGQDPAHGVPTSYYTAVQVHGRATVVDDPAEKAALLARQLAHFEPPGSARVPPSTDVASDLRLLPGIRGLRITIEHVRAKEKYGGNKPPDRRREIADRLGARGGPLDAAAAQRLLRRTVGP